MKAYVGMQEGLDEQSSSPTCLVSYLHQVLLTLKIVQSHVRFCRAMLHASPSLLAQTFIWWLLPLLV
jgi:hypothetical protein